ncbi:hypothetical protein [Sandaracinus amylolyticus]|uniref:hypothetical protein n=1 Tax=Sandaracinus amylolyticus TaxID=927083 RepID=UPI001F45A340|nr:hypothetical protein [Sandaracinus amylolyticus]UJR84996.1 Hypothetical protein I5071_70750 [Sandaracinus amylolyticus]
MAAFLPYAYLVRPREALFERISRDAWFARPHVWTITSPGDHDFEGQQRIWEAQLKLGFLARIHEDATVVRPTEWEMDRICRDNAQALLDWLPLTIETFDRLFALEPVGVGQARYDPDRIAEKSLRAVVPGDSMITTGRGPIAVNGVWERVIAHRASMRACALAGLRFLVPRLFEAFSELVTPPECVVHAGEVVGQDELADALARDGWVLTPRARLHIVVRDLRDMGDMELTCECSVREWRDGPRARGRVLTRAAVLLGLERTETDWTVRDATMSVSRARRLVK